MNALVPGCHRLRHPPVAAGTERAVALSAGAWQETFAVRGMHELVPNLYPPGGAVDGAAGLAAAGRTASAAQQFRDHVLDPFETSAGDLQLPLWHAIAVQRGHGGGDRTGNERMDGARTAGSRAAAARVHRRADAEYSNWPWRKSSAGHRIIASFRCWCWRWATCRWGGALYWPIYAAAERHGLPIGIHAGSNYHNPTTPTGWPSYHSEDYINQAQGFRRSLAALSMKVCSSSSRHCAWC